MTICGKDMLVIIGLSYEIRDLFCAEYQQEGVGGIFFRDQCLYVLSGKNIYKRMLDCCRKIKTQNKGENHSLILLAPYLEQIEWRILELNTDNKSKWIEYYNNPPFNAYTKNSKQKFIGNADDISNFMKGLMSVRELKGAVEYFYRSTERNVDNIQGVYMIKNKLNGKVYIGSSNQIRRRWQEHERRLAAGIHASWKLQAAYNYSHNIDDFEFAVIEEVSDSKQLIAREQYWMDYYDAYNTGYNCTIFANCMDKYLPICK